MPKSMKCVQRTSEVTRFLLDSRRLVLKGLILTIISPLVCYTSHNIVLSLAGKQMVWLLPYKTKTSGEKRGWL